MLQKSCGLCSRTPGVKTLESSCGNPAHSPGSRAVNLSCPVHWYLLCCLRLLDCSQCIDHLLCVPLSWLQGQARSALRAEPLLWTGKGKFSAEHRWGVNMVERLKDGHRVHWLVTQWVCIWLYLAESLLVAWGSSSIKGRGGSAIAVKKILLKFLFSADGVPDSWQEYVPVPPPTHPHACTWMVGHTLARAWLAARTGFSFWGTWLNTSSRSCGFPAWGRGCCLCSHVVSYTALLTWGSQEHCSVKPLLRMRTKEKWKSKTVIIKKKKIASSSRLLWKIIEILFLQSEEDCQGTD